MNIINRFFLPVMGCFASLGLSFSAFSMHSDYKEYLLELLDDNHICALANALNENNFSREDIKDIFAKIMKENKLGVIIEKTCLSVKEKLLIKLLNELMEIAVGDSDKDVIDQDTVEGLRAMVDIIAKNDQELLKELVGNFLSNKRHNFYVFKLLVEAGVDINMPDSNLVIPIKLALHNNSFQIAEYILKHESFNGDQLLYELLYDLYSSKKYDLFSLCVRERKLDIDYEFEKGETLLRDAVYQQDEEAVRKLLELGADPNKRRPLRDAISSYQYKKEVVEALLSSPTIELDFLSDQNQPFPFLVINMRNWRSILPHLIKRIDINIRNSENSTLYLDAHRQGALELINYLKENGADTSLRDTYNSSLLLHACKSSNLDLVKSLITKDNFDTPNTLGQTPLSIAVDFGQQEIAQYLINYSTSMGKEDKQRVKPAVKSQNKTEKFERAKKQHQNEVQQRLNERQKKKEYNETHCGEKALLCKNFSSLIKTKELNVGQNNDNQIPATISFAQVGEQLHMSISFKGGEHQLVVRPEINDEGVLTALLLVHPKTNALVNSATFINAPNIRFQKQITVTKGNEEGSFIFFGQMDVKKNKAAKFITFPYQWSIGSGESIAPPQPKIENPPQPKKSIVPVLSKETLKPKIYPRLSEIFGSYEVKLSGEPWGTVLIPAATTEKIDLDFGVDERGNRRILHVKPSYTLDNQFIHSFEPLGKVNSELKFLAGKTSFNLITHIASKKKTKKALKPLCFDTKLSVEERVVENDQQVVIRAQTTKGALVLTKIETINEERQEEISSESSDEESVLEEREIAGPFFALESYDVDEDYDFEQEEGGQLPEVSVAPEAPGKPKKKQRHQFYVNWHDYGLKDTQIQRDETARERRRVKAILEKNEERKGHVEQNTIIEEPQEPTLETLLPKKEARFHEVHPTIKLSPFSSYEDCDLVREGIEDSTWFGQGYELVNNRLRRLNNKLVIGMKNWQGYPRLAHNAAWGSLMATDLDGANYFEGKNVHISYHEQKYGDRSVRYLNISHHYRFELQKDEHSGNYLLYQLEPRTEQPIVYVLSNGISKRKLKTLKNEKTLTLAMLARLHIDWQPKWQIELEQIADVAILDARAGKIENGLRNNGEEIQLNSQLTLSATSNTINHHIPTNWQVFMITEKTGFIALDYLNRGQKLITRNFIFDIDSNGELKF